MILVFGDDSEGCAQESFMSMFKGRKNRRSRTGMRKVWVSLDNPES